MARTDGGWPYHRNKNTGEWVKCASNPCMLHRDGGDINAASPEDAEAKWQESHNGGMPTGMSAETMNDIDHRMSDKAKEGIERDAHAGDMGGGSPSATAAGIGGGFQHASYEKAASAGAKSTFRVKLAQVKEFFSKHVGSDGMLSGIDGNRRAIRALGMFSTGRIDDDAQNYMIDFMRKYMDKANRSKVDYDKLPAATESWSILANNPSASKETLHELADIAIENGSDGNFAKQVHVSDLVNNRSLVKDDAFRLYRHFPSETVSAQHCPQEILGKALKDPSTPASVRQVALRNPNAPADEIKSALLGSSDNVSKASALMNPRSVSFFADDGNGSMPTLFDADEGEEPFTKDEIESGMKAFRRMKAHAGTAD